MSKNVKMVLIVAAILYGIYVFQGISIYGLNPNPFNVPPPLQ